MNDYLKQVLHNLHTIRENIENNEFGLAEMNVVDTIKYVESLVTDFKPQSYNSIENTVNSKDELDYLSPEEVAMQITYFYLKQIEVPTRAKEDFNEDIAIILYAYKILSDLSFKFNENEMPFQYHARQMEICRKIVAICEIYDLDFFVDGRIEAKTNKVDDEQDYWSSSNC